MNRDHSVIFEMASRYCILASFADYDDYSISSKAFLPTVVDIMVIKKIRHTKGTFHAKMGSIKDRNGMDLTEQKILRRDGKNTQKNYTKKIFMTQIITMV